MKFSCFINGLALITVLLVFQALLLFKPTVQFLAPRLPEGETLPKFPLAWMWQVWSQRKQPSYRPQTLDGKVMVHFLEFGFKMCLCGSVFSALLLRLYSFGTAHADGFNRFSLSNLDSHSNSTTFWMIVVCAYGMLGIFAKLVMNEWRSFTKIRHEYLTRTAPFSASVNRSLAQSRRSVIIELDSDVQNNQADVQRFLEQIFGQSIHSCVLQRDIRMLYRMLAVQTVTRTFCCCCRRKAAQPVTEQIRSARAHLMSKPQDPNIERAVQSTETFTSTVFVTFRSVFDRVMAEQAVLSSPLTRGSIVRVQGAPEAQDIIWRNAAVSAFELELRHAAALLLLTKGILVWSVPVSLIYLWTSPQKIQQFPFLGHLMSECQSRHPLLLTLFQQYLPQLALMGLLLALPAILKVFAIFFEKYKTKADVERIVLVRTLMFQLATLYVTVLSGTLYYDSFNQLWNRPVSILEILRDRIPKVGVYFITFTCARLGLGLPMMLLRPWDLVLYTSSEKLVAPWNPSHELSSAAMVLTLGVTYALIAPAILPFCTLYFGLASIIYRYLFRYVYESEFDCAGMFWYDLFHFLMVGLLMGTLSLIALIALYRDGGYEFIALLPLPALLGYLYWYCYQQFWHTAAFLSYEDAKRLDTSDHSELADRFLDPDYYRDPALTCESSYSGQHTSITTTAATTIHMIEMRRPS